MTGSVFNENKRNTDLMYFVLPAMALSPLLLAVIVPIWLTAAAAAAVSLVVIVTVYVAVDTYAAIQNCFKHKG